MAVSEEPVVLPRAAQVSRPAARSPWRTTVLAGLASYLDAGSIVAGAAGLALWADHFDLSSGMVGTIGAFSSNAISAGVGALISGWLCDRHGRKRIYQWDLLLYAFGLLWIIFAVSPWMLVGGYVLTGLAVGADVPASWTLISEQAPDGRRARHTGMAQVLSSSAAWRGLRAAGVLHALERGVLPDRVARHSARADVRRRADRARDLELLRAAL